MLTPGRTATPSLFVFRPINGRQLSHFPPSKPDVKLPPLFPAFPFIDCILLPPTVIVVLEQIAQWTLSLLCRVTYKDGGEYFQYGHEERNDHGYVKVNVVF